MRIILLLVAIILAAEPSYSAYNAEDIKAMILVTGKSEFIRKMTNSLNKSCPINIGSGVRIIAILPSADGARYIGELTVDLPYKVLVANASLLKEEYGNPGIHRMCTSGDTRAFLDADLKFEYQYFTPSGDFIFSYVITKSDCENIDSTLSQ